MANDKVSAQIVDFTNVKDGGGNFNKKRVPAGDYLAKITKVQDSPSKKDDVFQYLFTFELVNKYTDRKFPYYCKLQENQLWKLRNLAIAAGLNVPKKRMKFDPSKIVGKLVGVTMEDDEYDGKPQSVIASVFPASELAEGVEDNTPDEDEEEEEATLAADEDEDEAEEETEDEGDDFDAMDRSELKAYITAQDSSFKAKKSQSDDDLREIARSLSSSEGDEEEDEEEEPVPAPKKKAKAQVSDDELEELDIEDL